MKHTVHKRITHLKKRYKHIAAAFAGAILMSSALLPGIPAATAHAAVKSNVGNTRDTSAEKMENENRVKELEGRKGKISGSEARNLIRQNFNMNKKLMPPAQSLAKENKADHTVKPASLNKPVDSPPVTEEKKAEPVVKPSSEKESKSNDASLPPTSAKEKDKQEQAEPAAKETEKDPVTKSEAEKKESGNAPTHYEKVLDIKATAYSPGPLDNDQWGDKTYLGTTIRPGVVAVDPNVIPLGSRLYVEYPDGHGEYAVAEDTGGAIKGNRIDIAMMNRDNATKFGIKPVKVYVVSTPKE
ncbi:MAG: hypothetical protein K0R78_48 [Pelosinus sp.]|jgi:3D (Asp-Asp-Asp) domain-containing protein|nr:hypothetical protein [Pelosinus sp.]